MNILALDPGTTTGWAYFKSEDGELFGSGEMHMDEVDNWLEVTKPGLVIYEGFRKQPWKKLGGSDMPASQVIGVIKAYCRRHHIKYVEQRNDVLPIAFKWAGLPYRKGHVKDEHSAIAHGVYYCQSHGIRKSRLLDDNS